MQVWDLWYPEAAARGLSFATASIDGADVLLVHAPPPSLRVEVYDETGRRIAFGDMLPKTDDVPMARLTVRDGRVTREDVWPAAEDLGRVVILPGGEAGTLRSWWNDPSGQEWRWQVEFYNHR